MLQKAPSTGRAPSLCVHVADTISRAAILVEFKGQPFISKSKYTHVYTVAQWGSERFFRLWGLKFEAV